MSAEKRLRGEIIKKNLGFWKEFGLELGIRRRFIKLSLNYEKSVWWVWVNGRPRIWRCWVNLEGCRQTGTHAHLCFTFLVWVNQKCWRMMYLPHLLHYQRDEWFDLTTIESSSFLLYSDHENYDKTLERNERRQLIQKARMWSMSFRKMPK